MRLYLLSLHVTAASLTVGCLFVQSLMVVMAQRLKSDAHREGLRILQRRVHWFIYYPILLVAVGTGLWLTMAGNVLSQGHWLHWKVVLVVILIGLGFLTGLAVRSQRPNKPLTLLLHIAIFLLSIGIIYLAVARPL